MRITQAEASTASKRNYSMNNLKYRNILSKKKEKTEIIEPEGLKYLIRRGNEKREFMWKNKKRFDLKQEILLRNAQLHAENDLQRWQLFQLMSSGDESDIAGTISVPQCLNFLESSSRPHHDQQRHRRHRRRSHSVQYVPHMHPTLSSDEIEAHIPGKTFERPNLYKRPSLLIASSSLSLKNGTSKMKINDLSMKSRMIIKSKPSPLTIGNFLRKIWAILFYKIRHSF